MNRRPGTYGMEDGLLRKELEQDEGVVPEAPDNYQFIRWKRGIETLPRCPALPRVDRAPPLPRFVSKHIVCNRRECHPSQ